MAAPEKRKLTDMQESLLEFLFTEAKGDVKLAMKMAGYPAHTPVSNVLTGGFKDEVIERCKTILALGAPKATLGLLGLIEEPTEPGAKVKLAAASQVLDRVNIVKTDKIEIDTKGGLFILPSKDGDGVSISQA
jgi:hypothetical protein